jgi:CHASE3 domain sensor protein
MKDFLLSIFGSKKKFIRLFLIICVIAAVICYGFYSNNINVNINKTVGVHEGK